METAKYRIARRYENRTNKDFVQSEFSGYIDEPYFRLYHDLEHVKKVNTHNVEIVGCASASLDKFVEIINASYSDLSVTKQQLENYFKTPVYCPELWILLKDKSTGNIVGCGIADYDKNIGELILEWIQVLPRYRQRGYGSIMVNYFFKKMQGKAKFATVSGKIIAQLSRKICIASAVLQVTIFGIYFIKSKLKFSDYLSENFLN